MKLIKKSEKLLLNKIKIMEESEEQSFPADTFDHPEPVVEKQISNIEIRESNYIPVRDNPIVQSVGNSGWQVSDIWKDIRLDNF
jgi:hypothetical protein